MIWYFDSGASRHITSRKDLFSSLDAAPAGKKVTCANNASYPIKGVGKILITISDGSDLCLPDVLYVPGIKKNLLSVSSLAKNGLRVIFEDDRCIVRDRENGYSLITTGTLENGLFVLDRYEKQIQACIAETKTQAMQDAELWHARFGHVGYGSLMTLQRHNMDGSVRATRKLQLVHSDVCGPMRTPSVGNSLYFVTFIDDFSRFCWVYPLKAKSDVFAVFQHYVSMVENETGCKVQTLRTDRGGEYMSGAFKDFLGKKGIKHQCTMPYTPQQNGVAKRKNRSLMEMARCILKAKSLPHKLWMEAVACAAHVLNRCPTRALKTITPYESWYDRKPSVSYLRVFGCLAYAHIPQQLRGKLDDKAVKCIFVGYSSGSKGYRLYNPATNKIFESRDVIFAETTAQPMVAFDVPHMQTQDVFEGFLPSFVENQESQQVDNFDQSFDQHVTPHDVEEIVREEQEVLREERTLPKWVQKTLQDSKLDAPLPRKTCAGDAWKVFNELLKQDVVTWASLISGYVDHGNEEKAFEAFVAMQARGFEPNEYTYASICKACSNVRAAELGRLIHTDVRKKNTLVIDEQNNSRQGVEVTKFKQKSASVIQEYFLINDGGEVIKNLEDLAAPALNAVFVKKLITSAMDIKNREEEITSFLLSSLFLEVKTAQDVAEAFQMLLEAAEDIALDILDAANQLSLFLARAVVDDILAPLDLDEINEQLSLVAGVEIVHTAKAYWQRNCAL
ncbi:hypothetical protein L7F22_024771 [Adiantum nelumboides]|nr:hypothetical protein [Adiantum nelumboides]